MVSMVPRFLILIVLILPLALQANTNQVPEQTSFWKNFEVQVANLVSAFNDWKYELLAASATDSRGAVLGQTTFLDPSVEKVDYMCSASTILSEKKGAAWSTKNFSYDSGVTSLNANWFYTWSSALPPYQGNVPWYPLTPKRNIPNYILSPSATQSAQYILGVNEPDNVNQANMTVAEAAALWNTLPHTSNNFYGSPAVTGPIFSTTSGTPVRAGNWLDSFINSVDSKTVDFAVLHFYQFPSLPNFHVRVQEFISRMKGKPVWITETGNADADPNDGNSFTTTQVMNYMKALLPYIENVDAIDAYSWFPADTTHAVVGLGALFTQAGSSTNLTEVGKVYANFNHRFSVDTPRELLRNNDFSAMIQKSADTNAGAQNWAGYQYKDKTSTSSGLELTGASSFIYQDVAVVPGVTYVFKVLGNLTNVNAQPGTYSLAVRGLDSAGVPYHFDPEVLLQATFDNTLKGHSLTFVTPPNITKVRISVFSLKSNTGNRLSIENTSFRQLNIIDDGYLFSQPQQLTTVSGSYTYTNRKLDVSAGTVIKNRSQLVVSPGRTYMFNFDAHTKDGSVVPFTLTMSDENNKVIKKVDYLVSRRKTNRTFIKIPPNMTGLSFEISAGKAVVIDELFMKPVAVNWNTVSCK